MSPADDPASLDRLHDIVLPAGISAWPPAPGWYVLFALGIAGCAWLVWRAWRDWKARAYRRAAIRELARCREPAQIAEVLRRTALVSFPREHIVALGGEAWLAFLDRSAGTSDFSQGPGRILATAPYAPADSPDTAAADRARACAVRWVLRHRARPEGPAPC